MEALVTAMVAGGKVHVGMSIRVNFTGTTKTADGTVGSVGVSIYSTPADSGSNFRIDATACQYTYNVAASSLGAGTYRVDISINGVAVGNAVLGLK
jgi:hypothetical protein